MLTIMRVGVFPWHRPSTHAWKWDIAPLPPPHLTFGL